MPGGWEEYMNYEGKDKVENRVYYNRAKMLIRWKVSRKRFGLLTDCVCLSFF